MTGGIAMLDCEQPQHISRTVWVVAALGALALHVGGVAIALSTMRSSDTDDDLGAPRGDHIY